MGEMTREQAKSAGWDDLVAVGLTVVCVSHGFTGQGPGPCKYSFFILVCVGGDSLRSVWWSVRGNCSGQGKVFWYGVQQVTWFLAAMLILFVCLQHSCGWNM
jgi:hypothetical protein